MPRDTSPLDKFKVEIKSVFMRWWEESDLDEEDMAGAIVEVCETFCDTSIGFESEIDMEDDEDE